MGVRTTITLDDEAYQIVKQRAECRKASLGEVISEIVISNNWTDYEIDNSGPFPVFKLPPGAPKVTLESVLEADAEL